MEWNDKVLLVQLSNSGERKLELQEFILKNIDNLDPQAWDMLANGSGLELIEEVINIEHEFYGKLYEAWNKLTFKETKDMSTRALMRLEMFNLIYEELTAKTQGNGTSK